MKWKATRNVSQISQFGSTHPPRIGTAGGLTAWEPIYVDADRCDVGVCEGNLSIPPSFGVAAARYAIRRIQAADRQLPERGWSRQANAIHTQSTFAPIHRVHYLRSKDLAAKMFN